MSLGNPHTRYAEVAWLYLERSACPLSKSRFGQSCGMLQNRPIASRSGDVPIPPDSPGDRFKEMRLVCKES